MISRSLAPSSTSTRPGLRLRESSAGSPGRPAFRAVLIVRFQFPPDRIAAPKWPATETRQPEGARPWAANCSRVSNGSYRFDLRPPEPCTTTRRPRPRTGGAPAGSWRSGTPCALSIGRRRHTRYPVISVGYGARSIRPVLGALRSSVVLATIQRPSSSHTTNNGVNYHVDKTKPYRNDVSQTQKETANEATATATVAAAPQTLASLRCRERAAILSDRKDGGIRIEWRTRPGLLEVLPRSWSIAGTRQFSGAGP